MGGKQQKYMLIFGARLESLGLPADYAHVSLGNTTTNNEYTLSTEMVGKIDNAMWIRFTDQILTTQFIGGGYITLERV